MQHSNIRDLNEAVAIFAKSPSTPVVKVYKVDPKNITLTDITNPNNQPINIIDDYWRYVITTPNEVCFLYIQFGMAGTILRVGYAPYVFFLISPMYEENLTIPYRHISFDGTILSSGLLSEAGKGLYYKVITIGINDSFMEVGGSAVPVRPYLSVSNSMVKYDLMVEPYKLSTKLKQDKILTITQSPYIMSIKTEPYKIILTQQNNTLITKK